MKKLLSALWVISLLVPALASAQPFPVNAAGVTNGHWHMNSKDIEANKKILVAAAVHGAEEAAEAGEAAADFPPAAAASAAAAPAEAGRTCIKRQT